MERESTDKRQAEADAEKQLHRMERALYEAYCDLGKMVLEMAETEGERTNRLVDQIIEKRRQLMALRGDRQCGHCGLYNEADSLYCKHCGNSLGQSPPTNKQEEEPIV